MPDKSFEEQVRGELSDLRIKPNDVVWQSVAASLEQKRRRRWAIWLLTLLVGVSGATFWFLMQEQVEKPISIKTTQQIMSQVDSSRNNTSTNNPLQLSGKRMLNTTTIIPKKENQSDLAVNISSVQTSTKKREISRKKESIQSLVLAESITSSTLSENLKSEQTEISITTVKEDSLFAIPEIVGISEAARIGTLHYDTVSSISQQTLNQSIQSKKTPQWKWRLALQAGQSGIRNSWGSLFSFNSIGSYNGFFNNNSNPSSPTTGSGSFGSDRIKSKDHFSMGVSLEMIRAFGKKKKSSIGLELGYNLYQTRTRIGSVNTGTVQFSNVNRSNEAAIYYGVNDSANYIASYHFIRLGVQYYRSINWIRKANLRWYVGMGMNAMLSGNGLHLGSVNNNIYYFRNRSLLQTMQLDMTTGFEIALGHQQRFFISPQAQYMLSNLSKQDGVNQHLFRPTVKFSWQLSKKKP